MSNTIGTRTGEINRSLLVIALSAMLIGGFALAQQSEPAQHTAESLAAERAERQAQLDELMGSMAEEMAVIRDVKDPEKRKALMATHREHMREAMQLMRGMGGAHMREVMAEHLGPGMQPDTDADRPHHLHKRMAAAPRTELSDAERLIDLENRLDMMQVMMESMMEHHGEMNHGGS